MDIKPSTSPGLTICLEARKLPTLFVPRLFEREDFP